MTPDQIAEKVYTEWDGFVYPDERLPLKKAIAAAIQAERDHHAVELAATEKTCIQLNTQKDLTNKSVVDRLKREHAETLHAERDARQADLQRAYEKIRELHIAIRKHRDWRGDDRCWLDDERLYGVLPEGFVAPERDTSVELSNCTKFIACRKNPKTTYVSPEREIERLKEQLQAERDQREKAEREAQQWQHGHSQVVAAMIGMQSDLKAEREEALRVLEPFAKIGADLEPELWSNDQLLFACGEGFTVGHCRAAAAYLERFEPKEKANG